MGHYSQNNERIQTVIVKKFDLIVGNPPYDGTGNPLYLQILECVKRYANDAVWLCLSQWVKNYKDTEFISRIKREVCCDLISHTAAVNPFDDACLANEAMVFHFGKADKYEDYEAIRLKRFSNPSLTKSIWRKLELHPNIGAYDKLNQQKPKFVYTSYVRGNQLKTNAGLRPAWDWTTLFGNEQRTTFYDAPPPMKCWNYWNFDTEEECRNFVAATEIDVSMFALFIGKQNQANPIVALSLMPWMGDYTHPWTNEAIAAELGLTKEEYDYIEAEMKDFGWKCQRKHDIQR